MERRIFLHSLISSAGLLAVGGVQRTSANGPSVNVNKNTFDHIEGDTVLANVSGVGLNIGKIGLTAQNDGLLADDIQDAVKARLSNAGIKILAPTEFQKSPLPVLLDIQINTVKDETGKYGFSINLNVTDRVFLVRRKIVEAQATIWATGITGVSPASLIAANGKNAVGEIVDLFVAAYNTANNS